MNDGPSRAQRLGAVAVAVGSSGYLALKAVWVAGATVGVASLGRQTPAEWRVANLETGVLGLAGLLLAAALFSRRGLRLPGWLLAPPLWVGGGLVAPFVVLLPASALLAWAGHPVRTTPPDPGDPRLETWDFAVVYGSFIVIVAGLAVAVPAYAFRRTGRLLARRLGDRVAGRGTRLAAFVAVAGAGVVALTHLGWATWLSLGRTGPPEPIERVAEGVSAALALVGAGGAVLWASGIRAGGGWPFRC